MNTESIIHWIILTILVSHTGIAWGILKSPGNILDRLPAIIEKIPWLVVRDLLTCPKCISGQVALWSVLTILIQTGAWQYSAVAVMWIMLVIVVTDQLNKRYGY